MVRCIIRTSQQCFSRRVIVHEAPYLMCSLSLQALSLALLYTGEAHSSWYYPSLYSPAGQGPDQLLSGDFMGRKLPHSDMMWDHYLKLSEVPEEEWDTWKEGAKVTFTLKEDGSGMTVFYTGLTEPLDYTFGVEQDFDLEDLGGEATELGSGSDKAHVREE